MSTQHRATTYATFRTGLTVGYYVAGQFVFCEGLAEVNDGGQGEFQIVPIGSLVDNGGTILTGGSFAAVRVFVGSMSVRWFGVQGGGVTDERGAIQSALNAVETGLVKSLDFDGLDCLATQTLYVPSEGKLIGNGATLRCPTSGFVNDGQLSGLPALIANKSAVYLAGEATDSNIEISGFKFVTGSQVAMDSVYLGNTLNAHVHDNEFRYQQAGSYTLAHVDCHHSNINALVDHNSFYHESTTHVYGACVAVRNSNSVVPSIGCTVSNNYMYKNGTSNADEFLWVNGATGVVKGSKVLSNTFVSGSGDDTSSMVTVYPFTDGGASAEAYETVVSNNNFVVPSNVSYGLLIGLSGDVRPAQNVVVNGNTFEVNNNTAIKLLTATKGSLITNNVCRSLGTTSTFIAGDSSVRASETVSICGNKLIGRYGTAFVSGGFIEGNYCEDCSIFSYGSRRVVNNHAAKVRYNAVFSDNTAAQYISGNSFVMDTVDAGGLGYVFYIDASAIVDIVGNIVRFKTDGFLCLRSVNDSAAAAKINFSDNRLYQDGATDRPSFQTFTYALGGSNNNWFYDRNSNNTPTSGTSVSGWSPAVGHLNIYNDIAAGTGVTIGYIKTSAGLKTIQADIT